MSQAPDSAVRTYLERHRAAFLDHPAERLRVPSASARPDVRLATAGFATEPRVRAARPTALECVRARPAAEVHGLRDGCQGPRSRTIILSPVRVKLPVRPAAGQDLLPKGVGTTASPWGSLATNRRHAP